MGVELKYSPDEVIVENVHLGDSLMILNYKIASKLASDNGDTDAEGI